MMASTVVPPPSRHLGQRRARRPFRRGPMWSRPSAAKCRRSMPERARIQASLVSREASNSRVLDNYVPAGSVRPPGPPRASYVIVACSSLPSCRVASTLRGILARQGHGGCNPRRQPFGKAAIAPAGSRGRGPRRIAGRIGRAMAFHDRPVEAQKHAAIHTARIDPLAQAPQRGVAQEAPPKPRQNGVTENAARRKFARSATPCPRRFSAPHCR